MHETLLNKYAIKQIGIYVEDLEKAAIQHSALFGSGPFIYMDPLTLSDGTQDKILYKGEQITLTKQMAYGHYGNLQVEFIQVLSDGPNPYKDLGHYGLHHFCIWVDDKEAAVKEFEQAGCKEAIRFVSGSGLEVSFIDCMDTLGHFVEIHAPQDGFWGFTKKAADDWDGTNPFRKMGS